MNRKRGIPYSVREAKNVIKCHGMNIYHRELMSFLIDEVERLQEKVDRLDLFEAYWDYVDKHGEEGLI